MQTFPIAKDDSIFIRLNDLERLATANKHAITQPLHPRAAKATFFGSSKLGFSPRLMVLHILHTRSRSLNTWFSTMSKREQGSLGVTNIDDICSFFIPYRPRQLYWTNLTCHVSAPSFSAWGGCDGKGFEPTRAATIYVIILCVCLCICNSISFERAHSVREGFGCCCSCCYCCWICCTQEVANADNCILY